MPLTLLAAPPGSGRTHSMLRLARAACAGGRRVWWVGLPAQRASVYRRATLAPGGPGLGAGTALLGLEFLTLQQVYYRLLARARQLHPLLIGSGRLVMVGEALAEVEGTVPAPGEARLFAQAIAEAKRYGARPSPTAGGDVERSRLAAVFDAYERLKRAADDAWDYDDFRTAAHELVASRPDVCEADLVIVDGFRELGPLELRIFRALGEAREVHVTLAEAPPGWEPPVERAAGGAPAAAVERYRAPNPVAEARWALRSLKRDLAEGGYDPLDLALIAPPGRIRALGALADEYGVPLMDETPRSLAETPHGRTLVTLLELPDHPAPPALLAVPELAELAGAALDAGVAGVDAIGWLARRLGLDERWRAWLAALEVSGEPLAWARRLLSEVLPRALPQGAADPGFSEAALRAAQEAARLADGAGFRAWWGALLRQGRLPRELPGGVTLTTATLASGRRFRKAYLLGANEGAYGAGESEDYFVPEEDRAEAAASYARLGLPRRFQGRDGAVFEELLARADRLVVTFPEADQGGPLLAEPALAGPTPEALPVVPAGSPLELPATERFRAELAPVDLGAPSVEALRRFDDCGFRYWGERRVLEAEERPWWARLRSELRASARLAPGSLERLAAEHPQAAEWLRAQRSALLALTYGVRLPRAGEGAHAVLDAAVRDGERATLVRFVGPGAVTGQAGAETIIKERWAELWAAGHLLEGYRGRVKRVDVCVWPILGEPIDALPGGIRRPWALIRGRQRRAAEAYERFRCGDAVPRPGFRCRGCPVSDVCREGRTA